MKKIAIITLALVLMLSSIGVGMAKWFDTISVEGTVTTGDVDLNITDYTGTWLFKTPGENIGGDYGDETLVIFDSVDLDPANNIPYSREGVEVVGGVPAPKNEQVPGGEAFLVAYAIAYPTDVDDTAQVIFENLFPTSDFGWYFKADLHMHYDGSIPAKVSLIDYGPTDAAGNEWLGALVESGHAYATMKFAADNERNAGDPIFECTQLHYCDDIDLDIFIQIPQEDQRFSSSQEPPFMTDELMNRSGSYYLQLEVAQWNEACYDDGDF